MTSGAISWPSALIQDRAHGWASCPGGAGKARPTLYALCAATGGFYFAATEATETESLRRLGQAIAEYVGAPAPFELTTWEQAVDALLALGQQRPTVARP